MSLIFLKKNLTRSQIIKYNYNCESCSQLSYRLVSYPIGYNSETGRSSVIPLILFLDNNVQLDRLSNFNLPIFLIHRLVTKHINSFRSSSAEYIYTTQILLFLCNNAPTTSGSLRKEVFQEWDVRGSASRWDALATIGRQTAIELQKARERKRTGP